MQYLQQRPVTWQQFREALLARFDLVNASEVARNKIKRLRQLASVQDYTRRFLALCAEIDNLSEAEKYDRYFDRLKAEVQNALVLQGITDFTALMASAERVDVRSNPPLLILVMSCVVKSLYCFVLSVLAAP
jgi:hypothetical protein